MTKRADDADAEATGAQVPGDAVPRRITARGATGVGLASIVAAASSYGVLVLAARSLDRAVNADFLAFWGLLFFLFGALGGLQSEVTRAVHVARSTYTAGPGARSAKVLARALVVGIGIAALLALSARLWGSAVLGDDWTASVALVAVAVVAFAGQSALAGSLAGSGEWTMFSRLVAAEAVVRVLLVALVVAVGAGVGWISAAVAAASVTWLVLIGASRRFRAAGRQRTPDTAGRFFAGSAGAIVGAASSAALVVGFPVLLKITSAPEEYAVAAPLLLAVQLTRAPLLIPLGAYQGVAITHFLMRRHDGYRPLLRLMAIIATFGILGAFGAAAVGPWLMATLLGPGYRVTPLVLAALTSAAAVMAILTLTGAATLALGLHRGYAVGWLAATVVTVLLLLLPLPLDVRVIASLTSGPVLGVLIHLWAVRPNGRRPHSSRPEAVAL